MVLLVCVCVSLLLFPHTAAVKDCHPGCHCEVENYGLFNSFSLTKVFCSGVGASLAPVPIPLDTTFLDLSSNSIRSVSDSRLSGPGYTTLVSLDLSYNHISQIHSGAFSKLRYLETLDLSHNYLEDLTDGVFSGLPVAELDLSDNRICKLRLEIFSAMGQSRPISLDVSNNRLTVVSRKTRGSSPNIKSLTLSGNRLKAVPDLRGIPLRYLNLDGNPLLSVERQSFADLNDLIHLSLSGLPELSSIQSHAFKDLQNLQVLDLSDNGKLKLLHPDIFTGLGSLQELNLSRSGVTSMPNYVLNYLPSIKSLTLGENVHCWKTHKQAQFHRQIGQAKTGEVLTCDVSGFEL